MTQSPPTGELVARFRDRINGTGIWRTAGPDEDMQALADAIATLERELEAERVLSARLKLEAQGHASEARTANSTIYEIYQALSGGRGEPGNWNGAEPARRYVAAAEARVAQLETALKVARPYVEQAVKDDGGIDNCEIGDRLALESIDAALSQSPDRQSGT